MTFPRLVDLRLGKNARRQIAIEVRRGAETVRIEALARPLSADEYLACEREDPIRRDAALVALSLTDVDDGKTPFATERQILETFTGPEVRLLASEVRAHQVAVSPPIELMSAADIKRIIADVQADDQKRLMLESFKAGRARELHAYYGIPASELLDGQVWTFIGLFNSYNEEMRAASKRASDASEGT